MRILLIPLTVSMLVLSGCASAPRATDAALGQEHADNPKEGSEPSWKPTTTDEMCAIAQCVHGLRIRLEQQDGSVFDKTFDALPTVQEMGVFIYAGHTVLFEAEVRDGRLVNLQRVDEVRHPERTISSRLEQDEDGRMMLITTNPFDRPLRIRMGIMPLDQEHLYATSSCPVIAGGSSYELWPYPIFQVVLGDLRLMDDDEPMTCVE